MKKIKCPVSVSNYCYLLEYFDCMFVYNTLLHYFYDNNSKFYLILVFIVYFFQKNFTWHMSL